MSDAQHYRTKDEVSEYQKIDQLIQLLSLSKTINLLLTKK